MWSDQPLNVLHVIRDLKQAYYGDDRVSIVRLVLEAHSLILSLQ
jgi:hypothetical protein